LHHDLICLLLLQLLLFTSTTNTAKPSHTALQGSMKNKNWKQSN